MERKMISDALHGGDDHGDAGCLRGGANEACGMEHAFRTEERTAAKLEGDDVPGLFRYPAGAMHAMAQRRGAASAADSSERFRDSWSALLVVVSGTATGASLEGA